MTRFLAGEHLWDTIKTSTKKAKRIRAAVAYVSKPGMLALKEDDVLIVDATDGAIASGQTSAKVLSALFKQRVSLFSHAALHAKIVVADSTLFCSSANLSESSNSKLLQAGLQTDNPSAISSALGLIEKLRDRRQSTEIDEAFLTRIRKIKVVRRAGTGAKSPARTPARGDRDSVTWLLGVHDIDEPKNAEERDRIKDGDRKAKRLLANPQSSTGSIRCGLKDRMREARRGDNIIMIDRKRSDSDPQRVYPHAPILLVQHEPNCIRVFYEEPPTAEGRALPWGRFKKLAKNAGLPAKISKNTTRALNDNVSEALHLRWDSFRK